MERIKLYIKGLSYSQTQSGAYALVLGEEGGERRLPIIIGGFEAQSIAIALEKDVDPPRPLTHDLFKNFSDLYGIVLKEVVIHKLQEGVFFSVLICDQDGNEQTIDARTSDAVALAIRFDCPIYTYREILDKAGVILKEGSTEAVESKSDSDEDPEPISKPKQVGRDLTKLSLEALDKLLEDAVANEDYEKAARVRDEIDKRNQN